MPLNIKRYTLNGIQIGRPIDAVWAEVFRNGDIQMGFALPVFPVQRAWTGFDYDVECISSLTLCLCWELFAQITTILWKRYMGPFRPLYLRCTLFDVSGVRLQLTQSSSDYLARVSEPFWSPGRTTIEVSELIQDISEVRPATKRVMDVLWNAFGVEECHYFDERGEPSA